MEFNIVTYSIRALFIGSILLFTLDLKPNGRFSSYSIKSPAKLEGPYTLNTLLNDAEHLYEGLIKGPESLLVLNHELYTGVHGGEVLKLSEGRITKVTKFGLPCEGQWQEEQCGRPFGLISDGAENLYVTDTYYGMWKYNINTGNKQCLVPQNMAIEGKIPKLFNSMAISSEGDIYWTDSSTDVGIQDGVYAMFFDGSGRLFKYSLEKNESTVLLDNLHFPNGVVISPDREFVVVAEMTTSRLIRHYVFGPKKGKTEVFLDKIPGFPDKLKVYGDYIIVPLIHARDAIEPVLFQYMAPYTLARRAVVRVMALFDSLFRRLNTYYSNRLCQQMSHKIGHFETVALFAPKRVTLLIVDWNGEVVESWHNLDGTLEGVSDVEFYDGNIYYGSPYNLYIGRTPIPKTNLNLGEKQDETETNVHNEILYNIE